MKYVITWEHYTAGTVYYVATNIRSSKWDSYGSNPDRTITRSSLLSEAELFSTLDDAGRKLEDLIKYKNTSDTVIGLKSGPIAIEVTDKELFKAKLVDEKVYK